MGIKKIARPINQAKNDFVKWLKDNGATNIEVFEGDSNDDDFDYYRTIDAFIDDTWHYVVFQMWQGDVKIEYNDGESMSIDEFRQLMY